MPPIIHKVNQTDWYATQVERAVEIRSRGTDAVLTVLTPPKEWGSDWGWNITPDGQGIVFTHSPLRAPGPLAAPSDLDRTR